MSVYRYAEMIRAVIALRAAVTAADSHIPRDDEQRAPAWWLDLDSAAEALCGEARDALHLTEEAIERWERESAASPYWWPCGCLINKAGAHRASCPDGVRGSAQ
jgi:hypothetical protein